MRKMTKRTIAVVGAVAIASGTMVTDASADRYLPMNVGTCGTNQLVVLSFHAQMTDFVTVHAYSPSGGYATKTFWASGGHVYGTWVTPHRSVSWAQAQGDDAFQLNSSHATCTGAPSKGSPR